MHSRITFYVQKGIRKGIRDQLVRSMGAAAPSAPPWIRHWVNWHTFITTQMILCYQRHNFQLKMHHAVGFPKPGAGVSVLQSPKPVRFGFGNLIIAFGSSGRTGLGKGRIQDFWMGGAHVERWRIHNIYVLRRSTSMRSHICKSQFKTVTTENPVLQAAKNGFSILK